MIRHGAELVHAYAAATVPRLCVVMRKAYGGAYIVMDSRGIGNDLTVAWPGAQIAVMGGAARGADPARQAPARRRSRRRAPTPRRELVDEYEAEFDNPYRAAERGLVDAVIAPEQTRAVLCDALDVLATKRDRQPAAAPQQHPALTRGTSCCSPTSASWLPACSTTRRSRSRSRSARRRRAPRSCSRRSAGR